MWCLETIKQINQTPSAGKDAIKAYEEAGIQVSGNKSKLQLYIEKQEEQEKHENLRRKAD